LEEHKLLEVKVKKQRVRRFKEVLLKVVEVVVQDGLVVVAVHSQPIAQGAEVLDTLEM
jgi:hypothetical protein